MIINHAYLVIRYDEVHDMLQETLSAPFGVQSSLNKTIETGLFGKAFGLSVSCFGNAHESGTISSSWHFLRYMLLWDDQCL